MIAAKAKADSPYSVPRVCGDDPDDLINAISVWRCSPRMRG